MVGQRLAGRELDARPDRIDFRDRIYRPPLVSLPDSFPFAHEVEAFLDIYLDHKMVRDQENEGACTGFGLAVVIDYIFWERMVRKRLQRSDPLHMARSGPAPAGSEDDGDDSDYPERVSAFMLYDVAKLYDEWDGEDYSGSSCRGALKGWHKHGVCQESMWRQSAGSSRPPDPEWRINAAKRPLGAYYRVDARSISDLQAAIFEVRAIYCSARVHEGWVNDNLLRDDPDCRFAGQPLPRIELHAGMTGGHAFAMVGYNRDGFIVQNSWGEGWGHRGFALLTYEDWIRNGNDAWVAALAAPMRVRTGMVSHNRTDMPLAMTPTISGRSAEGGNKVEVWSEEKAYDHAIVLGNEGMLIRRRVDAVNAQANLLQVALEGPLEAARKGCRKLVIYAHGGLDSERAAIERVMRMGPWFSANGIYPLFLVWRTSLLESISYIGQDKVARFLQEREKLQARGIGDLMRNAVRKLENAFDKAFEAAAEKTIGKPVWLQMKQNAAAASDGQGGVRQFVNVLKRLRQELGQELGDDHAMEYHLVGHSAGAILLGHMLDDFAAEAPIESATLFAPACTTEFALRYYGRAAEKGALRKGGVHIDVLSDGMERDDSVGPYGKSLLYLVSRALESRRKMPLLGLAYCHADGNSELKHALSAANDKSTRLKDAKEAIGLYFAEDQIKFVRDWHDIARTYGMTVDIHSEREVLVKKKGPVTDRITMANTHGSFDNNIEVMNRTIARILGTEDPPTPIDDLAGF